VAIFITEFWRDPEGRGAMLGGALNGPQAAAVALVLVGGLVLLERNGPVEDCGLPVLHKEHERMRHPSSITDSPMIEEPSAKDEAAND
jgi:hypothetical protein